MAEQGGTARARCCHHSLHKVSPPSATHPSCDRRAGQNHPSCNPSQGQCSHSFWRQHPQNCHPGLFLPVQRLGEAPVSLQHTHTLKAPKSCQELGWKCRVSAGGAVPSTAPPKFIRSRSRFCCAAAGAAPASRDRGKPRREHRGKLRSTTAPKEPWRHQNPTPAAPKGLAITPQVVSGLRKKTTLTSQVKQLFWVKSSRGNTGF